METREPGDKGDFAKTRNRRIAGSTGIIFSLIRYSKCFPISQL
jgi:hypothetical protein